MILKVGRRNYFYYVHLNEIRVLLLLLFILYSAKHGRMGESRSCGASE
jgi:hypothetical protein